MTSSLPAPPAGYYYSLVRRTDEWTGYRYWILRLRRRRVFWFPKTEASEFASLSELQAAAERLLNQLAENTDKTSLQNQAKQSIHRANQAVRDANERSRR